MDGVAIMLEEYKRLSDEVGKSLTNRFTVLGFGLAAVGVLLGFGVNAVYDSPIKLTVVPNTYFLNIKLPAIALSLMVPGTCFLTLFVWASEVRRARRASWYLWGLERRINHEMKQRLLRWEQDIRIPANPLLSLFRGHYYVIVAFFALVGTASAALGAHALGLDWWSAIFWAAFILALIVVPLTPYLWRLIDFDEPDSTWPASLL